VPAAGGARVALASVPSVFRCGELPPGILPGIPTGFAGLDAEIPGGGWPVGALTEVLCDTCGAGEASLLLPALRYLTRAADWRGRGLLLIDPPHLPYAPALAEAGIDLDLLAVVRPKTEEDALWAAEQALRSGAAGAVLVWARPVRGTDSAQRYQRLRRLQIAAAAGGGLGIVLAGAVLPLMLQARGAASWPLGWVLIGGASLCCVPLSLWAALQLRTPAQARQPADTTPLPLRRMLPEMAGYAGFGLGYIVYLTFLSAWMTEQRASAGFIALVWVVLGTSICLSPFVWRRVLARHASGLPLAMILTCIAIGSALPVVLPNGPVLLVSAVVFGLSVFMAPGAVTNFARQNLPPASWGRAISLFTLVFAVAQTAGPYGAGLVGDLSGNIGVSLLAAAGLLLIGAALALLQRPLQQPVPPAR
jgi:cell division inhibitor SulA